MASSSQTASAPASRQAAVQAVEKERLNAPLETRPQYAAIVPGHTKNGNFYPDPVVTEYPVTPTKIYVQAGSFTGQENAIRLRDRLRSFSRSEIYPVDVAGKSFYRVRLGPVGGVGEADTLLARLLQEGYKDTIIVVD